MKLHHSIAGLSVLLLAVVVIASMRPSSVIAQENQAPTVVNVVTSNTVNGSTDNYPGGSITPTAGG